MINKLVKNKIIIFFLGSLAFILCLIILLLSLISLFEVSKDNFGRPSKMGKYDEEIFRITSPDNTTDAVLIYQRGPLAIGSAPYNLYLVEKGVREYKSSDMYLQGYHFYTPNSINLKWQNANELHIKYSNGNVGFFTDCGKWDGGNCKIHLRLIYDEKIETKANSANN